MSRAKQERSTKAARRALGRHMAATLPEPRYTLGFASCEDGALLIYVMPPGGAEHWWEGEPVRIEPDRVSHLLAACGDALARKPSTR